MEAEDEHSKFTDDKLICGCGLIIPTRGNYCFF